MTITKRRADLERFGSRLALQALAVTTMAVCVFAGYKLYELIEKTRFDSVFADAVSAVTSTFDAFFAMDETIAMILVPALVVGILALGGMYLWGRRA